MPHKYCTLPGLRAFGFTATMLPDAQALDFIAYVSGVLDSLTHQFFQPELQIYAASGTKSKIVHRGDLVPILEVSDLSVDYHYSDNSYTGLDRVFGRRMTGDRYLDLTQFQTIPETGHRLLRLMTGEFPQGTANVLINGAFGWLEQRKAFETTLATELKATDTTLTLTEVLNSSGWLEIGDFIVVVLQEAGGSIPALLYVDTIQALDSTAKTVTVDEVVTQAGLPIAAGATVRCFGGFPRALKDVFGALAKKLWNDTYSTDGSDVGDRLISERVDNYSYQLESVATTAQKLNGLGAITGSTRLDQVLRSYSQGVYVGIV